MTDLAQYIQQTALIDTHEHLAKEREYVEAGPDVLADLFNNYIMADLITAGAPQEAVNALVDSSNPDIAARWKQRNGAERKRPRTAQSFCVPKAEIAAAGYDLSINRYKDVVHQATEHRPPQEIIAELKLLEQEIVDGLDELEAML